MRILFSCLLVLAACVAAASAVEDAAAPQRRSLLVFGKGKTEIVPVEKIENLQVRAWARGCGGAARRRQSRAAAVRRGAAAVARAQARTGCRAAKSTHRSRRASIPAGLRQYLQAGGVRLQPRD